MGKAGCSSSHLLSFCPCGEMGAEIREPAKLEGASLAFRVETRDSVSNMVEGDELTPRSSSDPHTCTVTGMFTCM